MTDQKNTLLAIVLSALVLIGWQIFVGLPQMQKQKEQQPQQTQQQVPPGTTPTPGTTPAPAPTTQAPPGTTPQAPGQPGAAPVMTREQALALSPRAKIDTPLLAGSIALKGARIDDLSLTKYRETVDPTSPAIVLLAPSGSPNPFYAEFGWSPPSGAAMKLPGPDTVWQQQGSAALGIDRPVTLTWDNGEGLEFRRTIAVDDKYMFTVKDEVVNKGTAPVTLYPYGLISRHGMPHTLGYYILHEGMIGVFGDKGLQEETYATVEKKKSIPFTAVNSWLGITDKYWAATLIPDTRIKIDAKFSAGQIGNIKTFQADYIAPPQTIAPGARGVTEQRLFAGAKEVSIVDGYNNALHLNLFDRLIDWGWFYFITKPLFVVMDWIYHKVGNFGIAILIVTVLVKILFFPLANKSYASMAKMKAVQPEMMAIRERYRRRQDEAAAGDDGALQEGEDQSDCRLPADRDPDSGVLLALQGAVRHHRDAARAVLRLDQGPLGARSDHGVQPVRAHPLGPRAGADDRALPAARRLAADHGRHHVAADEAQPAAARPDAADDLRMDAGDLHLHAGELPGRAGDLLGLEQFALGRAAERDHAQARRQDRAVRQHQGHRQEAEGAVHGQEEGRQRRVRGSERRATVTASQVIRPGLWSAAD